MTSDGAVRTPRIRLSFALGVLLLSACTAAPESPSAAPADSVADANVAAARRAVEEMWNNRNMAVIAELYATDHASYTNGVRDTMAVQPAVEGILQQFPDARVEIIDVFGTGDKTVMHWTFTATAVPATTKSTIHGATIARWADGKMVESQDFYDQLAFTLATGATVTPPAGAAPPTTTTGQ